VNGRRNLTRFFKGKKIKPRFNGSCGYFYVMLNGNRKKKCFSIHRLIAKSFIPNQDNKREVNHINGNKKDNRVDNLEWVTPAENSRHASIKGLTAKGEDKHYAKLTDEDVRKIRFLSKFMTQKNIGKLFHVCRQVIGKVERKEIWSHVV
jgi:hypothetical protein